MGMSVLALSPGKQAAVTRETSICMTERIARAGAIHLFHSRAGYLINLGPLACPSCCSGSQAAGEERRGQPSKRSVSVSGRCMRRVNARYLNIPRKPFDGNLFKYLFVPFYRYRKQVGSILLQYTRRYSLTWNFNQNRNIPSDCGETWHTFSLTKITDFGKSFFDKLIR